VPAGDPDRLIRWFIGVAVIAVGANLLSNYVVAQNWALASAGCLCCGAVGRCAECWSLRRERYRTTRAREIITEGAQSPIPRTGVPFLLFGVAALAGIEFMMSLLIGEFAYGFADRRAEYVRIGVLASSLLAGSASRGDLPQSEPRLPRPGRNRGTRQRRRRHSRRVRRDDACHDG
jgi:hypothetical protein